MTLDPLRQSRNFPISRSYLITSVTSLLVCMVTYPQVPGTRMWTSLGDHSSAYYNNIVVVLGIIIIIISLLYCSPFSILHQFQDKVQTFAGHGQLIAIWPMPIFLASTLLPHMPGTLQEHWTTCSSSIATCSHLLPASCLPSFLHRICFPTSPLQHPSSLSILFITIIIF